MSEIKEVDVKRLLPIASIPLPGETEKKYQIRVFSEDKPEADLILHFGHRQCLCLIGQLKALVGD